MNEAQKAAAAARTELPATQAAFDKVRDALLERWRKSSISEADLRERLFHSIQVLDAVQKTMMVAISNGRVEDAAEELAARRKKPT